MLKVRQNVTTVKLELFQIALNRHVLDQEFSVLVLGKLFHEMEHDVLIVSYIQGLKITILFVKLINASHHKF